MFSAGETEHPLTGRLTPTLEGVATSHGEVIRVHNASGVVFEGPPGRRLTGMVVDSAGVGLPGARVRVAGTEVATETDSTGRFELDHMAAGRYELNFSDPALEQLWYNPEPVEIEIGPEIASVAEVRLEAPSLSEALADICGRSATPSMPLMTIDGQVFPRTGVLTGRVVDEQGNPVPDATVHFLATAFPVTLFGQMHDSSTINFEDERFRTTAKTSSSGFYRVCWLPTNLPIEAVVFGSGNKMDKAEFNAALSLADLYPDRVRTLALDPRTPHRSLDFRLR